MSGSRRARILLRSGRTWRDPLREWKCSETRVRLHSDRPDQGLRIPTRQPSAVGLSYALHADR